jgi:hypothetical protein
MISASRRRLLVPLAATLLLAAVWALPALAQTPGLPSGPVIDEMRIHERLVPVDIAGTTLSLVGPGGVPVEAFIPEHVVAGDVVLVIHFHGAAWLVNQSAVELGGNVVAVSINTGGLSSSYSGPFSEAAAFDSMIALLEDEVSTVLNGRVNFDQIILSAFSAGYGAVRAVLRNHGARQDIRGVLLLDGMHAAYVPAQTPISAGGLIDSSHVSPFAHFAARALSGTERLVITHSDIRPGSYASNAETADWLIARLGLQRVPEVREGPRGMHQLSAVREGGLTILGFAGTQAPDHIDHLHALPEMLRLAAQP